MNDRGLAGESWGRVNHTRMPPPPPPPHSTPKHIPTRFSTPEAPHQTKQPKQSLSHTSAHTHTHTRFYWAALAEHSERSLDTEMLLQCAVFICTWWQLPSPDACALTSVGGVGVFLHIDHPPYSLGAPPPRRFARRGGGGGQQVHGNVRQQRNAAEQKSGQQQTDCGVARSLLIALQQQDCENSARGTADGRPQKRKSRGNNRAQALWFHDWVALGHPEKALCYQRHQRCRAPSELEGARCFWCSGGVGVPLGPNTSNRTKRSCVEPLEARQGTGQLRGECVSVALVCGGLPPYHPPQGWLLLEQFYDHGERKCKDGAIKIGSHGKSFRLSATTTSHPSSSGHRKSSMDSLASTLSSEGSIDSVDSFDPEATVRLGPDPAVQLVDLSSTVTLGSHEMASARESLEMADATPRKSMDEPLRISASPTTETEGSDAASAEFSFPSATRSPVQTPPMQTPPVTAPDQSAQISQGKRVSMPALKQVGILSQMTSMAADVERCPLGVWEAYIHSVSHPPPLASLSFSLCMCLCWCVRARLFHPNHEVELLCIKSRHPVQSVQVASGWYLGPRRDRTHRVRWLLHSASCRLAWTTVPALIS